MTEEPPFRTRFWNVICQYEFLIRFGLAVDVTILIFLIIASFGVDPTDSGYYILVVDFVILVPLLGVTLFVLYRCSRHTAGSRF